MKLPAAVALALAVCLALLAWRQELFTVSRPGESPRALEVIAAGARARSRVDVVLPSVPVGMRRVRGGEGVTVVHYWAMWERHGRAQAVALDSLQRLAELSGLRVVVVCFDPFPSVARFVGRARLRLGVLIDGERELRAALPCPSIPYTYVLDHEGDIAVAQAGEVDWLSPATRSALAKLLAETDDGPPRSLPREPVSAHAPARYGRVHGLRVYRAPLPQGHGTRDHYQGCLSLDPTSLTRIGPAAAWIRSQVGNTSTRSSTTVG